MRERSDQVQFLHPLHFSQRPGRNSRPLLFAAFANRMKCYLPEMARLKLGFLGFLICGLACADVTPVTVKQAVERMKKSSEIIVVDIRTPGEFSKGHIKKAINIDMNNKDFAKKLTKLDREKTYLMHCRSGGRSTASLPVWNRLGFKNVLHLSSGTLGWVRAGQPLVVAKKK